MLRRKLLLASLAPAAAALSCGRSHAPSKRTVLRVAPSPYLASSPFYVGVEAGYYRDAGLDLQLMKELPSLQSIPLLASGKQDVGFVPLTTGLLNAISRGARVRIVAAREIVSPSCALACRIYVRSAEFPNGATDIRQLRHHRISVVSTTGAWMFALDKLLESAGMTRSDVEIRIVSANQRFAALRAGTIDAIVISSIDMTPMMRAWQIAPGPSMAGVMPGFQITFLVFGARLLDGDVRDGALFLRAWLRGLNDFLAGKTPAFETDYARSNGLDPALIRSGCRDSYQRDGRIRLGDLSEFIAWAVARGDLQHSMSAPGIVDTRFLDATKTIS